MPKLEESKIYEYYCGVFTELEQKDGAYYPSKHDPIALSNTANHFGISEEDASRIFDEFSKHAADLEMEKVNKFPPAIRKQFIEQRFRDILCNNHDLPFFKLEGEPSKDLSNPLDVLNDAYQGLVEVVADNGWTIPLSIDMKRFNELQQHIGSESDINEFFTQYYDGHEARYLYRKVKKLLRSDAQKITFEECFNAYNNKQFMICRTGLITVLEGMISEFDSDPKSIRVMKLCNDKANEERSAGRNIRSLCWCSMYCFVKKLYEKSDFSQTEPPKMNRHWIEHGRTDRLDDGIDCLKLLNAIATMALIKESSY